MVVIDIDKEMRRQKKEEREMERIKWNETEKQMRDIWEIDDAKMRRERAIRRLEFAREQRNYTTRKQALNKKLVEPKLQNIIISKHQNIIIG